MSEFLGYPIELEKRDELYAASVPMLFTLNDYAAPEEIDPRQFLIHADQSNMGSCGGAGNTNGGEALFAAPSGQPSKDVQFSILFSYLEAQRLDGLLGSDRGSTINSGVKVSKTIGYLLEKHLPYKTPYPRNARTLITDEMRSLAGQYKLGSSTPIENYDAGFQYMSSGSGPLYIGTIWNNSFYGRNGVLESVSYANGGGHAYIFAGYSKRKDSRGRNYWYRVNSHANDFVTEVAPSVIDGLLRHQYTTCVGISDLSTPGPRDVNWAKEKPFG